MHRLRTPNFVLALVLLPVSLIALVADRLRPAVAAMIAWPPLERLRVRVSRLPPAAALPLFLVPEACSRSGWVVSVWLIWRGHAWQSLAVYGATKLIAGCTALWIYAACEPVLLRVRWFARCHAALFRFSQGLARSWRRMVGPDPGAAPCPPRATGHATIQPGPRE